MRSHSSAKTELGNGKTESWMHCPCPAQGVITPFQSFHSVPLLTQARTQMTEQATGDFQSGATDLPSPPYLHQCPQSMLNPILAPRPTSSNRFLSISWSFTGLQT